MLQFDVYCKATNQNFDCGCDRYAILRLDSPCISWLAVVAICFWRFSATSLEAKPATDPGLTLIPVNVRCRAVMRTNAFNKCEPPIKRLATTVRY